MGQQIVEPNAFITHERPQKLSCLHGPSYRTIIISLCSFFALLQWLGFFSVILRPTSSIRQLQLNPDRTFQIAVFSDIHYGEDEHSFGPGQDIKSAALMRQVLATEKPDLVVLNGDLITGENTFQFNSTKYVHQIVAPLIEGQYLWASTYGNHDSKFNLSREALYKEEARFENSFTQHGPSGTDGVTNYVLLVYPPAAESSKEPGWFDRTLSSEDLPKPSALLWFFDSRGGAEYQHEPANEDNIDDVVTNGTVNWFRKTSANLRARYGSLPSLAFVHIPILPFVDLQQQSDPAVHGPHYPGLNADVPPAQQGYSKTGREAIPFMQALLDTPGLHSIYSGHDHGDSWCGRWPDSTLPGYGSKGKDRPFLCFCKHAGYGGYGDWNRGVRQIKVNFDERGQMSIDTWVRMQQGDVITSVSLNETYGEDVYDTEDGGYRHSRVAHQRKIT